MKPLDLSGQKFGYLTGIEPTSARAHGQVIWRFKCVCGADVYRAPGSVKSHAKPSCGCKTSITISKKFTKHGKTNTPIWLVWYWMVARCKYKSCTIWKHYGGRGIKVCGRWSSADGFINFYNGMGDQPFVGAELEREDNDKDYSPDNCKWATHSRQMRNTRKTWRAECGTPVIDLAEAAGIPITTVSQRVKKLGWSLEKALSTPKFHNGVRAMPERKHSRSRKKKR